MRITLFSSRSFILRKINKAWKVYKRGKGISNLGRFSVQELTLGSTMDVCSTGNHDNLPEMSELRKNADSAFFKANSMMDFGRFWQFDDEIYSFLSMNSTKFEYS
jgi:hypothetical protein